MARVLLLALFLGAACVARGTSPVEREPAEVPGAPAGDGAGAHAATSTDSTERAAAADAAPERGPAPRTIVRAVDGRCEPMPRQGEPCGPGDGYCVISWGERGGWSSALWCRGGKWEIENERNLP